MELLVLPVLQRKLVPPEAVIGEVVIPGQILIFEGLIVMSGGGITVTITETSCLPHIPSVAV